MTTVSFAMPFRASRALRHFGRFVLAVALLLVASLLQAQPTSLRILAPNGGETLLVDSTFNIQWTSNGLADTLLVIEYSVDSGGVWKFIDTTRAVNGVDTLAWVIPDDTTSRALVRIRLADSSRTTRSNRVFTIAYVLPPRITVLSPNGGQIYEIDSTINVRWSAQAVSGTLHVEYSVDSGVTWKPIGTKPARIGNDTLRWTIPNDTTSMAFVRVRTADTITSDRSNRTFSIVVSYNPSVKLIYPNGGEVFDADSLVIIEWQEEDLGSTVRVELSVDSGRTWALIGQHAPLNGTDTLHWIVPNDSTTAALIRVGRQGSGGPGTSIRDTSDAFFTIRAAGPPPPASITELGPDGGVFHADSMVQIMWRSTSVTSIVRVDVTLDSGATWTTIESRPPRDGMDTIIWTTPNDSTKTGFFRIMTADSTITVMTTLPFSIITRPTGSGVDRSGDVAGTMRLVSTHPLPASDRMAVTWEQSSSAIATLSLFDSRGALVMSVDLGRRERGIWSETIDISRLAAGSYLSRLGVGDVSVTTAVAVAR